MTAAVLGPGNDVPRRDIDRLVATASCVVVAVEILIGTDAPAWMMLVEVPPTLAV